MKYPIGVCQSCQIVESWPKELDDAVEDYCKEVLKMTYEEKRRQIIDAFRVKLFDAALEYSKNKKEAKNGEKTKDNINLH